MQFALRLFALVLLLTFAGASQTVARDYHPEHDAALIAKSGLPPEAVGFVVYDLKTGKRVLAHNADSLFQPASAIKAPVGLAAIHVLGQGHRFETRLYITGTVLGGTLDGDVILVGGGDPILLTDDLVAFAKALRERGIERVDGRFLYDDSLLAAEPVLQAEHENDVAYNPGLSGLALNFNRVQLAWLRGANGKVERGTFTAITEKFSYPVPHLSAGIAKESRPPRFPTFVYEPTQSGARWLLTDKLGRSGAFWLPVRRPGPYAAQVFRSVARDQGIALPVPTRGAAPEGARLVYTHWSEPLIRTVHKMLYFSNNLVAETLGAHTAKELAGKALPLDASAARVARWWSETLPKTDWDGMIWENHSGLSDASRVTPEQLTAVMLYAADKQYEGRDFRYLLKRFAHYRPRKNLARYAWVRGKTGTMDYVRSLTGYLQTNGRRRYAFTVLIADSPLRDRYAEKNGSVEGYPARAPRAWNRDGRELLRDLVYRWMREL